MKDWAFATALYERQKRLEHPTEDAAAPTSLKDFVDKYGDSSRKLLRAANKKILMCEGEDGTKKMKVYWAASGFEYTSSLAPLFAMASTNPNASGSATLDETIETLKFWSKSEAEIVQLLIAGLDEVADAAPQ